MPNFSKAARKNMVDCQIHTYGVVSAAVLDAFEATPRELFVPESLRAVAYADRDLPLGRGRFLPAPALHAKMIQMAEIKAGDRVLDIGGGTGYGPAILSALARHVVALEDDENFLNAAQENWRHLGISNVEAVACALTAGCAADAPYDAIFINGAVGAVPPALAAQLAPGGRLLAILRAEGAPAGKATLFQMAGGALSSRPLFDAGAEYLPGFEPRPGFVF